MMVRTVLLAATAAVALSFSPAMAEGPMVMSDQELDNVVAGKGIIGLSSSSQEPGTIGPTISGDIYGNTFTSSGNGEGVLPSWSPGPWVCNDPLDCSGPTDAGGSMGDFIGAALGVGSSQFANGNDQDIDFSAPHL